MNSRSLLYTIVAAVGSLLASSYGQALAEVAVRNFNLRFSYFSNPDDNGFGSWSIAQGLKGSEGLPDADPDSDGLVNLMEYGLGGDPTDSGFIGTQPKIVVSGGQASIPHLRRDDPPGELTYCVQKTGSLAPPAWVDAGASVTNTNDLGNGFSEITNTVSAPSVEENYRVRIEPPLNAYPYALMYG